MGRPIPDPARLGADRPKIQPRQRRPRRDPGPEVLPQRGPAYAQALQATGLPVLMQDCTYRGGTGVAGATWVNWHDLASHSLALLLLMQPVQSKSLQGTKLRFSPATPMGACEIKTEDEPPWGSSCCQFSGCAYSIKSLFATCYHSNIGQILCRPGNLLSLGRRIGDLRHRGTCTGHGDVRNGHHRLRQSLSVLHQCTFLKRYGTASPPDCRVRPKFCS